MDVLNQINEYRKSNKFCDIIIIVGDRSFKAHKALLAASSGYFSEALDDDTTRIIVEDVAPEDFDPVLSFVYTGKIDINDENLDLFNSIAEKLNMSKLKDACEKFQDDVVPSPEPNGTDFVVDNLNKENQNVCNESPLAVEIIRSKPVSIFPITKRSERKAKQDAYLTMNQAFEMIEDFEDGTGLVKRRNRRPSDEDYHYEDAVSASASSPIAKKRRSSRSKLTCLTCFKRFDQGMDYQLHLLCHDDDTSDVEAVDSAKLLETMEKAEVERRGFKPNVLARQPHLFCDICDKTFTNSHNLSMHMKTHNRDNHSTELQAKKEKRQFPCSTCLKVFKTSSHLKRHMITHTGERKHCCTTCGKLFLKNDHLKRHERTHTAERPFACEECGKTFRDKDHLKRHHLTHSDIRPFFCDICGKQFKERNTLKSHLKIHSASSLACNLCGRSFKAAGALERHLTKHQQDKAHVCEVCGKNFEISGRLRKHMLTHTGDRPHHCETCGKQFRDPHSLRLHQKRHTGIGLHPCPECGKEFTNPFHLKRHQRIHSGEKPFKCDVCKRTFARTDNLEAHKRTCLMKQQNAAMSPTSPNLPSMVTFINHIPSEKVSEKNVPKDNTSSSLTNIMSQISWPEQNNDAVDSQKDSDEIAKEVQKSTALGNFLSQMTWSEPRHISNSVQEEPVNLEKCMSLILPPNSAEVVSPVAAQPPPALIHRQRAKVLPTNLGVNIPPSNLSPNSDFVRSRYYALQSQLYSHQTENPPSSRQYSQVQMPTPLHTNQTATTQDQSPQVLNFDVNAAVNSFIGYGAGL